MHSTEALVGLPSGDVVRTNSIARLMPSQRWHPESLLNITGVPAKPTALDYDDSIIESFTNPHYFATLSKGQCLMMRLVLTLICRCASMMIVASQA